MSQNKNNKEKPSIMRGVIGAAMNGDMSQVLPVILPMIGELNPAIVETLKVKQVQYKKENPLTYNIQTYPIPNKDTGETTDYPLVFLQELTWIEYEGKKVRILSSPLEKFTVPKFIEMLLTIGQNEDNEKN